MALRTLTLEVVGRSSRSGGKRTVHCPNRLVINVAFRQAPVMALRALALEVVGRSFVQVADFHSPLPQPPGD